MFDDLDMGDREISVDDNISLWVTDTLSDEGKLHEEVYFGITHVDRHSNVWYTGIRTIFVQAAQGNSDGLSFSNGVKMGTKATTMQPSPEELGELISQGFGWLYDAPEESPRTLALTQGVVPGDVEDIAGPAVNAYLRQYIADNQMKIDRTTHALGTMIDVESNPEMVSPNPNPNQTFTAYRGRPDLVSLIAQKTHPGKVLKNVYLVG